MWLTPHPHAISIDKKMSNLVTVNYNKLVTMEGVSNSNGGFDGGVRGVLGGIA